MTQSVVIVERDSSAEVQVLSTGTEVVEVQSIETTTVVEREVLKDVVEVVAPGGPAGPPGPAGPEPGLDLLDLTIVFENGLA